MTELGLGIPCEPPSNGNAKLELFKWLVCLALAAIVAHFTMGARVSVLENELDTNEKRLERIENKLDRLLERGPAQRFFDAPLLKPEG